MTDKATTFRVFISSPSDVFAERERVERVITRLNGEFGGGLLQAIRWERTYYTADKTFQDQIPLPSETDLVICILWKRLGFELPPEYRRPDGTTPTGTEYEFEDAMEAARSKGSPDVLVYRKSAPVLLDAEQVEMERAQFEALKTFWSRWFRTETGHFVAAYQAFDNTDTFETQVEDHIRQWLLRHKVASAGVTWPIEQRGSPFRGLQPFDAAHTAVFFGRRRVIERARERLTDAARRGTAFMLVLGTSGSGKSSLARAGLLPRLMQPGAVPGVDLWRCCTVRPSEGDTPLHALARALYGADALPELAGGDNPAPTDLAALLAAAPDSAARAVRLALGRATLAIAAKEAFDRPVEARLLLMVDQFEEALTAPEPRDAFARALTGLIATGLVWVAATLRSDLYAPFQAAPALTALRDAGAQLDLLPPSAAELNEIVTGPAAAAGLRFDVRPDGTALDEVLTQAADQPGALPLLQLALDALFEARDPAANLLTFAAYDAIGGLPGVVERRAEATLAALDPEAAASLPDVLRALVEVTEDGIATGRAAPLDQVAATPDARRLVDAFVAARLLVAETEGEQTRIRVAHDALLSGWPRAAAAIAADREALRTRGRIDAATHRWVAEGRDPDFLLPPGRPLAEAAELASSRPEGLGPDAHAFVQRSMEADAARRAAAEAHAQRELRLEAEAQQARADAATRVVRRTRAAAAVVFALLLLATGVAFYANTQRQEAERQTAKAEQNFQAALDGGARLVAAVDAHLGDGGMTRRVARELLNTADKGIGSLLPEGTNVALPPRLLDTDSRLQASFSSVLAAVCDSAEARTRAERALAVAEAAFKAAPTDERALAIVKADEALGFALEAEGKWPAARAAFERAEARGAGKTGEAWAVALQKVRRALAYTMVDTPDQARSLILLRDDLRWLEPRAAARPDDPEILAWQAADYRQLAYAARVDNDLDGSARALDQEDALLRRLVAQDPNNVAWTRYLGFNAQARGIINNRRNDFQAALVQTRESARHAAAALARDPGNALWRIGSLSADVRYALMMVRTGDEPGALALLRPDMEAVKALSTPGVRSPLCQSEAAQIQSLLGNAMAIMGKGQEGRAAFEANVALARSLAEANPGDPARQRALVDAYVEMARSDIIAKQEEGVIAATRAALVALQPLLTKAPGDPAQEAELTKLHMFLGDSLAATGKYDEALATFEEDRARNQALMAAQPDNPAWRLAVVQSLLRTNMALVRADRAADQWIALQAAGAAIAPLLAQEQVPTGQLRTVIEYHQALGSAQIVRQEKAAGLDQYRKALAAAEALLARTPDDVMAQTLHSQAIAFVGMGQRFLGQSAEPKTTPPPAAPSPAAPSRALIGTQRQVKPPAAASTAAGRRRPAPP